MAGTRRIGVIGLAAALAWFAPTGLASGQQAGPQTGAQTKPAPPKPTAMKAGTAQTLGSVRVPRQAVANGEALPAGTYTVRLASDAVPGAVGQTPEESKWVEFVQGSQVRGKEVATVMTAAEVKKIAETSIPAPGTSKVQVLKGNDYLRVWINRANTHYLVHLALK